MDKFKRLALVFMVFHLGFVFNSIWCIESNGAEKTREKLSGTRYVDPKGYFKITPPRGWRIQKYSQDTRGKVAFIKAKDVDLRALARAADFDTFDGLLKLVKDIERKAGVDTNIREISFLGRPAVKRNFVYKGRKLLQIDFMEGNIKHNLQYCAPLGVYDKYLAVATDSMNTYETVLRAVSAQDIQKHAVAQDLRLAQLWLEKGDLNLALEFVTDGLKIEPKNPDLLKLKRVIESKNIPRMAKGEKRSDEGKDQLETLKIIKVGVEQSFGEARSVKLPFYDISKKILEGSGFTVVGDEANKFDGMLKIKVNGTPLANKYGKDQYLYTGAEIKGNLKFLVEDSNLYSKGFEWRKGPPGMIHFGDMIYMLWGIGALADSLNTNKEWHIRERIIEVLGRTKDTKAIKLLVYYKGGGTNVVFTISRALSQLDDRMSVRKTLIAALKDKNYHVRSRAAEVLGYIEKKGAVEPLIAALQDEECWVRSHVAEELGKIKDLRAVEPLIAALEDKCQPVRCSSAEALGKIKDLRAVEPLIAALKDKNSYVRTTVEKALRKITGQKLGIDQDSWKKWWLENKAKFQNSR